MRLNSRLLSAHSGAHSSSESGLYQQRGVGELIKIYNSFLFSAQNSASVIREVGIH